MKRKNEDKMKKMTIWGYYKKHLKRIPLTVLFFIATKLFSYLLVPYSLVYLKKMIDSVSIQSFVAADFLIFVLINFLIWGTAHLSSFLDDRLELSAGNFIAYDVVEKLHRVSYSVFEDAEAKDIIQRINNKPEDAVLGYFHNCMDIVLIFVQLCGFMIIIAKASYWLTVFLILMLLFTCVFDAKSMSLINRMFQHQSRKEREVAELEYHLKNKDSLFVLRIYDGLQRYIHKYFKRVEAMEQERKETTIQANRYVILIYVLIGSWMLISIVFSVGLLTTHKISVGLFSVLITSFIALLSVSEQFSYSISTIFENRFRVQKLLEFMNFSERTVEAKNFSEKEEIAISFENVVFHYPNDKKNILQGLSFQIKNGEHVSIIGNNGSGKSSLIKAINGLATKYDNAIISGSVNLESKDVKDMKLYEISKLISSVFQNPKTHFFNVNTTLELLFYLENIGLDKEEMDRRLGKMLEVFPIKHLLNRDIFELSGGEKQILCLAAAYISGTKTILLDEPSSNLDDFYIEKLKDMLKLLKKKGISLILAEHRIYYLMDIVDQVFLIKDGKNSGSYKREEFLKLKDKDLKNLGIRSKEKTVLNLAEDLLANNLELREFSYNWNNN